VRVLTTSVEETRSLGNALAPLLLHGDLVLLAGDLGSGKTALAQGIAAGLGVTEPVVSPSFAIVREYQARIPLLHVDIYRLGRMQDLHDIGFDEMLDAESVVVVEWGDAIATALPGEHLVVRLDKGSADDDRIVSLSFCGDSWRGRAKGIASALASFSGANAARICDDVEGD